MSTSAVPVASRLEPIMKKSLSEILENPKYLELLRFDIAVTAEPSQFGGWQQIQFTLTSSPGIIEMFTPEHPISFKVLIMDEFGNRVLKPYSLSSRGQTMVDTVEVPLADPSKLHGSADLGRTIYVIADVCEEIHERSEVNNFVSAYCYTIG